MIENIELERGKKLGEGNKLTFKKIISNNNNYIFKALMIYLLSLKTQLIKN